MTQGDRERATKPSRERWGLVWKSRRSMRRAYTLLEVLVVVAILGTAAALVVPSMSSAGNLRVQAAVREMVADITFAQSDAVAYQARRAIVFYQGEGRYVLCEVRGAVIDPAVDAIFDPSRPNDRYEVLWRDQNTGGAAIIEVDFDGDNVLIFDELGGPVETADGDRPSSGGVIRIRDAMGQTFRITVEAYTGRVLVDRED